VIGSSEHAAEHLEYLFLDLCTAVVIAPGMFHQHRRAVAIAQGEQDTREHVATLGG
jgi:hypothetical protein